MVTCTDCNKEFNSVEGLQHHKEARHGAVKKKVLIQKRHYWYAGIITITAILIVWGYFSANAPGKYDNFARCLGEKEVTFYGAFWCSHCAEQKQLFGKSAKLLPYVECSTADGKAQTPICVSKNIKGYPTWEFADGTMMSAVMTPQDLAEKTGCPLE